MGRALSANEHVMGKNGRLLMMPASLRDQQTQREKDLELRSTCESVPTCETVRSLGVFNGSRLQLFWDVRLCGVKPQLPRVREALSSDYIYRAVLPHGRLPLIRLQSTSTSLLQRTTFSCLSTL